MEALIRKLRKILKTQFVGAEPELEQAGPLDKIGGYLIWRGFEGVEQLDRQRQLNRAIRERLSVEEQLHITTILTVTPDEVAVMRSA